MGLRRALATAAVAALITAACDDVRPRPGGEETRPEGGAVRVGMALAPGGLGDQSINDAANRGLQDAIADGLVAEDDAEVLESGPAGTDAERNVATLAEKGFDLVVAVGHTLSESVAEVASRFPGQRFAVVDGFATTISEDSENIVDLTFKENEGSFLVGAAAGLATETGVVGFLGGERDASPVESARAGYQAGVRQTCSSCEVLVEYIGDSPEAFTDPSGGKALAETLYERGVDVVYHAAGRSGLGLFRAAAEAGDGALAIGAVTDQYLAVSAEQKPHILTSMLKRVDREVHDTIRSVVQETFQPGLATSGVAESGVDYAASNPELLDEEIQARLEELRERIITGEIVVPEGIGG